MGSEFLMPQKYEGVGCGLTVAVCGLDDIQYDSIVIYLKEREENRYEVSVNKDNPFKSDKVTFTGLEEKRIYHVSAEIHSGGEVCELNTRMVSNIKYENEVELFSATVHGAGGKTRPFTPTVRPLGGE